MGRTAKKANLLWVDLEMTGLSPEKDRILEVAAIATDWDFNEIANYTAVVKCSKLLMQRRMTGEFWKKNKESYDGLMAQNKNGKPRKVVEKELLEFIEENFDGVVYLAGNSIHQDRRFICREWPTLDARLHYRMLDVSSWKLYFENVQHKKFVKPEQHRALDDIKGSIEELKWYLKSVK